MNMNMGTLSSSNFKNLMVIPFKDKKSAKKILIGNLLVFSTGFVPILPLLIVIGYIMQIATRIIDGTGDS